MEGSAGDAGHVLTEGTDQIRLMATQRLQEAVKAFQHGVGVFVC